MSQQDKLKQKIEQAARRLGKYDRCTITSEQGCQDTYFGGGYCNLPCAKLMDELKK